MLGLAILKFAIMALTPYVTREFVRQVATHLSALYIKGSQNCAALLLKWLDFFPHQIKNDNAMTRTEYHSEPELRITVKNTKVLEQTP